MGTNGIDARIDKAGCTNILVCSGGDDQSLSCFTLEVKLTSSGLTSQVARHVVRKEACLSAIRSVAWVSSDLLVVSGYDQELSLWEHDPQLNKIDKLKTSIGDVNCLAFGRYQESKDGVAAVAGAGVELVTVETGA